MVFPEAPGKAEAYDTWAAQSGNLSKKTGKYRSGPLKGKTFDQGMQQFDRMWRSAPDSIKEKYASRSANRPYTDLAPSERLIQGISPARVTNASLNASLPGESPSQTVERQKRSRIRMYQGDAGLKAYDESREPKPRHDQDANGVPDMIQRPSERRTPTVSPSPAPIQNTRPAVTGPVVSNNYAPGSDEARAAALTENSRNERFATADNGSSAMRSAVAMQSQSRPMALGGSVGSMYGQSLQVENSRSPIVQPELKKKQEAEAMQRGAGYNAQKQREETALAESERKRLGLPSGLPTDERMHAEGKVNGGQMPVVKAPRGQYQGSPMPAAPVTPPTRTGRIGATPAGQELVGMNRGVPQYAPIGEVYGQSPRAADATPGGGGVGPVRPAATDESIRADYQSRMNTPQARAGAQRMMEADRVSPERPRVAGIGPTPERPSIGLPGAQSAPSQLVAGIKPTPAPDRYKAAQEGYQASQLDPAKAREMDAVYAGANSRDQATITANSLKRAAGLPSMVNAPRAVPIRQTMPPPKPLTVATRPVFAMGRR